MNTETRYGWVSRLIHWLMAAGVIAMLALGAYIVRMEVGFSNLWLFGVHKSIGMVLFALIILRLIWHRISPPPEPLPAGAAWQDSAARIAHRSFYVLLLVIPIFGYIGSAASGLDVLLFERWKVPSVVPVSEAWEDGAFLVHNILTKLLAALVLVHVAAALKRRDGTLRRMLLGSAEARGA